MELKRRQFAVKLHWMETVKLPLPRSIANSKRDASITVRTSEDTKTRLRKAIPNPADRAAWLREWLDAGVDYVESARKSLPAIV